MECQTASASLQATPGVCTNPIFVIGSPRSGTTILATSLAKHTGLWTSEESEFLFDLFGNGKIQQAYQKAMARPKPSWLKVNGLEYSEFMAFLGMGVNAMFTSRAGGRRWVEQTPHYGLMANELSQLFPGAQFVHILRDARRVVHSMINVTRRYGAEHLEAAKRSGHLPPWPEDFHSACSAWRWCVAKSLAFCSANPARGITVTHEELVADTETVFHRILSFLNLEYEEGPAEFLRNTRINSSFHRDFTRPCSGDEADAPWMHWSEEQKRTFLDVLEDTLVEHKLTTFMELGVPK